jgi:hypothetical protein
MCLAIVRCQPGRTMSITEGILGPLHIQKDGRPEFEGLHILRQVR